MDAVEQFVQVGQVAVSNQREQGGLDQLGVWIVQTGAQGIDALAR